METSEAVRNYVEHKLAPKLTQLITKPIEVNVTISVHRHFQEIQCSVLAGDGFSIQVESKSPDLYASVDLLADKLERQLKRRKEVLKNHKRTRDYPHLVPALAGSGNAPFYIADEWQNVAVDAEDIIKYEQIRRRRA